MSLYVFDVHDGDSLEWNDEDHDCEGNVAIEKHARKLLGEAGARQIVRGGDSHPATVIVYQANGPIVMSVHGWLNGTVRVLCRDKQIEDCDVRENVRVVLLRLDRQISKNQEFEA